MPLFDLYLIKWVTVCFDFLLALVMMRASGHLAGRQTAVPVFLIVLSLPTVLLDGACWAQCDPVYITFVVLSLYALSTDRPYLSAISLSVAFAFKLQTIFFFPVVLLASPQRYRAATAAFFLATGHECPGCWRATVMDALPSTQTSPSASIRPRPTTAQPLPLPDAVRQQSGIH